MLQTKKRKRKQGWWIVGSNIKIGPYETKKLADVDRIGLNKSAKLSHREITCEPIKPKGSKCNCKSCKNRRRIGSYPKH